MPSTLAQLYPTVLKSDRRLGETALRAAAAYSLVLSTMYRRAEVVKNSCMYSMGDALPGSLLFTPGAAENANDVGGRGSAYSLHSFQ